MPSWLFSSLRAYQASFLRGDLIAGLTVGAVLIPEALAYATIAGVSPVVGLYAAPPVLVFYAACGSSRHLVTGPMSATSTAAPLAGRAGRVVPRLPLADGGRHGRDVVGFAEGLGAAKTSARHHYDVDANRELPGLGAASIGSGLSSGMVVNGSLSKTAVNGSAGANSQLWASSRPC
jgi:MFS superfamily sulfate permease-like transporter